MRIINKIIYGCELMGLPACDKEAFFPRKQLDGRIYCAEHAAMIDRQLNHWFLYEIDITGPKYVEAIKGARKIRSKAAWKSYAIYSQYWPSEAPASYEAKKYGVPIGWFNR